MPVFAKAAEVFSKTGNNAEGGKKRLWRTEESYQIGAMSKKVMILDDDADILQICTIILQKKGYKVLALDNSSHVTEHARSFLPDAILMDNWIPGPGGIAATLQLKAEPDLQDIPVIFFSANSNVSELARHARADYFLQKPFDIVELEEVVRQATNASAAI